MQSPGPKLGQSECDPQVKLPPAVAQSNSLAPKKQAASKSWAHLIAGASGGMATAILTSPLDVLRTRLQGEYYRSAISSPFPSSSPSFRPIHSTTRHLRETYYILSTIGTTEGWRGFFRGLGPSVTGVVPATAIKFYTYGNCKRLLSQETSLRPDSPFIPIFAAASAGIVTGTATNPIWLIKTRLQLDKSRSEHGSGVGPDGSGRRYKSSLDCAKQVLRQEGIRGFYRGLTASYLGAIETTLHLGLYEQMKIFTARLSERRNQSQDPTYLNRFIDWMGPSGAAGASKLVAGLIAYPHEVIRTRLRQAPLESGARKYTGLIQCCRSVWQEGGLSALYGGLTPHLLRAVPSAVITLGVYEFVLTALGV